MATNNPTPLQIIRTYAPRFGLDPAAVVAYALTQGGLTWGAVGDQGTSFGPFQFHRGGALGSHDEAWANSEQGLIDGMRMMQQAIAGKISRGASTADQAKAIILYFGRGSNPSRDVQQVVAALPDAERYVGAGVYDNNLTTGGSTPAAAAPSTPQLTPEQKSAISAREASAQAPGSLNVSVAATDQAVNDVPQLWAQIAGQDNISAETSQFAAQYLQQGETTLLPGYVGQPIAPTEPAAQGMPV